MASRKMTDSRFIPFLSENYEREKWLRMHWTVLHMDKVMRATQMEREPKHYTDIDLRREQITAGMPALARDAIESALNKKTASLKDISWIKSQGINKECAPAMKPITDELRKVLYKNKNAYLKLRNDMPPDKKYNYVECTSWNYGWNLDESSFKLQGATYGRVFYLRRMKGVGPQPDPVHYQTSVDSYTLCHDI